MSDTTKKVMNEKEFESIFEKACADKSPDYHGKVNIALIGKVSSGKSSLLNALLDCDRDNAVAEVGAESGVTTELSAHRLGDDVLIVDCPGLDDVRNRNSEETRNFLQHIDIGIFVVTGSADSSQKANYDDLARHADKVFVVLNKVDEWDDLEPSACEDVVRQWMDTLGVDRVFGTCTKGFDPRMRAGAPMDLRGITELKEEIDSFLHINKKDLLLARHLRNKEKYAERIINGAIAAVSVEALLPGSAAYITATQITAIASLHFLYTGRVLHKDSILKMLPAFMGRSVGTTAFLWAKSFLPPTGVLDVAAAGIAASITYAMLSAVKWVLENELDFDDLQVFREAFDRFQSGEYTLERMEREGRV